jgi:anthranilate/para-aminobenzoate synthase component I
MIKTQKINVIPSTLPDRHRFIESAKKGRIYPVYTILPFIPPQDAFEHIMGRHSFLLESIKGPEKIARYSFAGSEPFLIFRVKNRLIEIESNSVIKTFSKPPLKVLKELITSYQLTQPDSDFPPFSGGAVGMFSYDFVHYFERLPRTTIDDLQIPDAHFLFADTILAFDHKYKRTYVISCPGACESFCGSGLNENHYGEYYDNAADRVKILADRILRGKKTTMRKGNLQKNRISINHEMQKQRYEEIVRKAKEYIRAGDIFQANLSQRVSATIGDRDYWQIYRTLSTINPSPFAAYLDMKDYQIISSSPERLLLFRGNTVETRPIAGTRPRARSARGDIRMRKELLLNEKERAEHLMLIDLERNDLGKISDYGSVHVDEFMITEDYSHVIHIVSNIKGTVAPNKSCFDAIRAAFPGGTITGVPKVRCMEIIDELEPVSRGPYTGSMGYIGFNGSMDLNIIIRTFVIKNKTAYVQAGAGIVADSEPEREYFETLKKAEALVRTLERL